MKYKKIFKCITGSFAHGTYIEGKSDIDYKSIYIQDSDEIISMNYTPQIDITQDDVMWEIQKFIELLENGNPSSLEILFSPQDCILETSPQFNLLLENKEKFLTKKCARSFANFGYSQIKKASATGKKFNIEDSKMVHKTPFDFTYYYAEGKVFLLKDYLEEHELSQEKCGLVRLDHMKDCYALYYDHNNIGYRGIIGVKSNEIRLSSIPKDESPLFLIYYNVEAYSKYMKEYKEYKDWLENRNMSRFVDVISHNQTNDNSRIDGKNMLHCIRLLNISREIAENLNFSVRRPNVDYLLKIRHGEVPLSEIMEYANKEIAGLDELYRNSNLPDEVDPVFVKELLLKIRKYEEPIKNIAVICEDIPDFLLWKIENEHTPKNSTRTRYLFDGNMYYCISKPYHLISHTFDDIIISDRADRNKYYDEIKTQVNLMTRNESKTI